MLLSTLGGAEVQWVRMSELLARSAEIYEGVAQELRQQGRRPYVVPLAASGPLGIWGYVRAVEELSAQLPSGSEPTIVYPVASGGTGAGILLGLRLCKMPGRAIGVITTKAGVEVTRRQVMGYLEATRERFSLDVRIAPEEIELVDGSGLGYGVSAPEELRLLSEMAVKEGVVLDPTYTVKALFTLRRLIEERSPLITSRVVLLHTGGVYGLFPFGDQILSVVGVSS
jgi:1-aminocyclopropane-1-carboxylate deaminase/D-cysteine desulfhydrase-like pyridoxal-dependent ACC family enzyme